MADEEERETFNDTSSRRKKKRSSWFGDFFFVCCCKGFLNPNGVGSREYYETLGLIRTATNADIKKAYKKLSLSYHPDKLRQRGVVLTEDMQEQFRKIKQAYEVLSDPERRTTYDELGINGLLLKEEPASFAQPSKFQELVEGADARAWCTVLSILGVMLAYAAAFPVLFAIRVDGVAPSLSFALVFLPLWLLYALVSGLLAAGVARGKSTKPEDWPEDEEWRDEDPLLVRQMVLGGFTLFVLFQVLLVIKLDGGFDKDTPWPLVLLPYFFYELAQILGELFSRRAALEARKFHQDKAAAMAIANDAENWVDGSHDLGFEDLAAAEEKRQEAALAASNAAYYAFRLVQVLVVSLKGLSMGPDVSWWAVLVPLEAYLLLACCQCTGYRVQATKEAAKLKALLEKPDAGPVADFKAAQQEEFDKALASSRVEWLSGVASAGCCSCLCLTLHFLLLAFYLDSGGGFSFFWLYLPLGSVVGCVCCLVGCSLAADALGLDTEDTEDVPLGTHGGEGGDEEDVEQQWPGARAGDATPPSSSSSSPSSGSGLGSGLGSAPLQGNVVAPHSGPSSTNSSGQSPLGELEDELERIGAKSPGVTSGVTNGESVADRAGDSGAGPEAGARKVPRVPSFNEKETAPAAQHLLEATVVPAAPAPAVGLGDVAPQLAKDPAPAPAAPSAAEDTPDIGDID